MKTYNITVIKGDGIGPEITDEALKVLDAAGEKFGFKTRYDFQLMGGCAIDETGVPLPEATLESCKKSRQCFIGAVAAKSGKLYPDIFARKPDFWYSRRLGAVC
jgi:3-isopropylmalate dehydrogenase